MNTLHWTEPVAFLREEAPERLTSGSWRLALSISAILLIASSMVLAGQVGTLVATVLGVGLFLAVVRPFLLHRLARCSIVVSPKGVSRAVPTGKRLSVTSWPWDEIRSGRLVAPLIAGTPIPAVEVVGRKGEVLGRIGLAATPTPEEIATYFRSQRKSFEFPQSP
jgi:hypothetical protein